MTNIMAVPVDSKFFKIFLSGNLILGIRYLSTAKVVLIVT